MFTLASWFVISLVMGLGTLWAVWSREVNRWRTVALIGFLGSIFVSGGALLLSQGWSSSCSLLLPGKYNMIGYLPVPDERIYLFLDTEYGPKTCHIPWDSGKADELQKNGEGDGSEIEVSWGEDGDGEGILGGDLGGVAIGTRPPKDGHPNKPAEGMEIGE